MTKIRRERKPGIELFPGADARVTDSELYAIRALAVGKASEDQQKLAFNWITEEASGDGRVSFVAGGVEGDRQTSFKEGRRFVAKLLKKAVSLRPEVPQREEKE